MARNRRSSSSAGRSRPGGRGAGCPRAPACRPGPPRAPRLPTVRALAADVGLAVNTVARVYRELEADGVVVTEGRRGTFVASTAAATSTEAADAAAAYAAPARRLGLGLPDALRLVERTW